MSRQWRDKEKEVEILIEKQRDKLEIIAGIGREEAKKYAHGVH